jgi:P-type Cu+ transporter
MEKASTQPAFKIDISCYHCGEPCKPTLIISEDKSFCCEGCKLVYEILEENKLCNYYNIAPSSGNSPEKSETTEKFSYLNDPIVVNQLVHFQGDSQNHITFLVPGIHCSSCIWLLEHLQKLDSGVLSSTVNFPKREVTVVYSPSETSLSSIAEKMTMIGYEPHISLNDIEEKQSRTIDRSLWYKIGLAGFCFGNVMMLSFPEYFSIADVDEQPGLRLTFSLLNLGLSIPVLLYSASDFFKSAIGAIRARQLNIDLPIAAAILMTFLRSVYELATATGPGYFDSMTGIVFFMLIGRAFQNKTYQTLAFDRDYKSYFPVAVSIADGDAEKRITVTNLKRGMRMIIRNEEIIPADAILLRGDARIDYSFVTGESAPVHLKSGDLIYAGGRQMGARIELEIVKSVKQSYLTGLWNRPAFQKDDAQERQATLENSINKYFTIAVFLIALLSAAFWIYQGEYQRMADAVTTILIVACPCILLLAVSFTNGNVLRILGKNGFFLRNAFVIQSMTKVDTIVFDKTGTLTIGQMDEPQFVGVLNDEDAIAIHALTGQSNHPLSRSIWASFKGNKIIAPESFIEIPGKGILGKVNGNDFLIGSAEFTNQHDDVKNASRVYITKNGISLGYFEMQHRLREGLDKFLGSLKNKYDLYLLSGDLDTDKNRISTWFKDENMRFNQKPEDKLNFIQELQNSGRRVMMIGDGLNDAGALQQSNVGIAVSDDLNNFSPACDAIIDGKILSRLSTLLSYCLDGKRVIAISFAFSLIYNFVGLYFAVRGELSPVIAAILMPIASISIVSFATLTSSLIARGKSL